MSTAYRPDRNQKNADQHGSETQKDVAANATNRDPTNSSNEHSNKMLRVCFLLWILKNSWISWAIPNQKISETAGVRSQVKIATDTGSTCDGGTSFFTPSDESISKAGFTSNTSPLISQKWTFCLSEPVTQLHSRFKVQHYWKINSGRLPNLSRMGRDYLAALGPSSPSERALVLGDRLEKSTERWHYYSTITAGILVKNRLGQLDNVIQPLADVITQ